MHRVHTIVTLVAILALSACSATEGATPVPSRSPTAKAESLYQAPSDPCDAVSAATRKKHRLTQPEDRTFLYTGEATAGGDVILTETIRCTWVVDNPAKGQNGRPNQFNLTLDFQVPGAEAADEVGAVAQGASRRDVTPAQMAQVLLDAGRADLEGESAGVTTTLENSEPVNDLGYSAYSAVLTREDDFGKSTAVVVALQAANAHIMVAYSGADLEIDPSLPEGLQLVKSPVPPRRFKPAAEAVARDALASLGDTRRSEVVTTPS